MVNRRDIARNIRRALRLVWESGPWLSIANLVLLFVQGLLPLVSLVLMKRIVDSVATGIAATDPVGAFRQAALYIGLAGATALTSAAARSLSGLVSEAQSLTVTDRVQDIIHAKSIEVDVEYYENSQYYDTLHRAQQEAPYRPTRILHGLIQTGQNAVSLAAMVGLLLSLHWAVAAVLFVTAVPVILVRLRFAGGMYRWQRERTPAERLSWYFDWLLTRDSHAKEVRLFGLGDMFRSRYRELRRVLRGERLRLETQRSLADLMTQLISTAAVYGAFAFIAYRAVRGTVTLGDLVMYYQAFQRGQGFLRDMMSGLGGLYEDSLFLSNFYEFLGVRRKVVEAEHPVDPPRPIRQGLSLSHVSFRYPGSQRSVLDDVSLHIRPGEVVALVGENGSGKTTLVKLLCRLYDPDEGTVSVDGIDLKDIDITQYRRNISVIFQDYARYNLTARENIAFGNVLIPQDSADVAEAARKSGADAVIGRLPQGFETTLGRWFANGEELSVGEWQKIALARAFLRDAQVIVLDEPTSAMDARAEFEVFQRFRELVAGRSAVLISHRFSTVRLADTIHVLQDGRIVESGSHDELVRRAGVYARLFEAQARSYR